MPMPNTPSASPRSEGGNHELTSGIPIANVVPPNPSRKPTASIAPYEFRAGISSSTGTMVSAETSGNMSRAPYLSVSAPAAIRPSEPTSTGTATSSDCSNELSPSRSL